MKMKKFVSFVLAATMAATTLTACGSSSNGTTETKAPAESGSAVESSEGTIKIGGIGPTTGGAALYGLAVQRGAQIAIDEINAAGGINGMQVEYNFQDDEADAEKSVNAYNVLKDWGMDALVGTTTSTPCIAVATESAKDNIFQITPSATAVESITPENVFRICFSDPTQGKKSAQYIGEHKLATKVAVIYDSSETYSTGIYESFAASAAEYGLEIVATGQFTADSKTDFSVQLQQAQSAGAELVFLPIYYAEASLILTQANKMGFAPKFFGCDGLDGLVDVENFDVAMAENVMLLTPFAADATDEATQSFVGQYKEKYNETPIQFAADAYDAVYAIKLAAEKANVTADMSTEEKCEALKGAMTEVTLEGLTGTITWDAAGEPEKEPKAVEIHDGAYTAME